MPDIFRPRDVGNLILDRLPDEEFESIRRHLSTARFELDEIIQQFHANVTHVYFPTTAMTSVLTILEDEAHVESTTVGREGFVGIAATLGDDTSPHRVICQMEGGAIRMPVGLIRETIGSGSTLDRLTRRYSAYRLRYASQGAACNALHTIEDRACRWLLVAHDQAGGETFPVNQEFMASMLGVRRQTITVLAGSLQGAGLITYRQGIVTVIDRPLLEKSACECYATIRGYYERLVR